MPIVTKVIEIPRASVNDVKDEVEAVLNAIEAYFTAESLGDIKDSIIGAATAVQKVGGVYSETTTTQDGVHVALVALTARNDVTGAEKSVYHLSFGTPDPRQPAPDELPDSGTNMQTTPQPDPSTVAKQNYVG